MFLAPASLHWHGGPSFSPYKPLQNVDFRKVGNMQFSFRNCTHILTRTQREKFEYMFLVKIVNKGTSLKSVIYYFTYFSLINQCFRYEFVDIQRGRKLMIEVLNTVKTSPWGEEANSTQNKRGCAILT